MKEAGKLIYSVFPYFVLPLMALLFSCSQMPKSHDSSIAYSSSNYFQFQEPLESGGETTPLRNIYFDVNSVKPTVSSLRNLNENATWLRNNPGAFIQLEGYCDRRGGEAYNQTLGVRRALAAKRHLVRRGVDEARFTTISHGRTKGHSRAVMRNNRRVEFIVYYRN